MTEPSAPKTDDDATPAPRDQGEYQPAVPQESPIGETAAQTPTEEPSPASPDEAPAKDEPATDARDEREIRATIEAILFTAGEALTPAKIAKVAEVAGQKPVKAAIAALNEQYEQAGSSFRIELAAGGYRMMTLPQYADVIGRLVAARQEWRLTQAALETLAILAYRQPILRADVEAIRGVACGEVLRGLMEKQLVKIVGRAEIIGRPMLYGTTRRFLEVFGIAGLEDLPKVEELKAPPKEAPPAAAVAQADQPPAEQAPAQPVETASPAEPAAEDAQPPAEQTPSAPTPTETGEAKE